MSCKRSVAPSARRLYRQRLAGGLRAIAAEPAAVQPASRRRYASGLPDGSQSRILIAVPPNYSSAEIVMTNEKRSRLSPSKE